MSDIRSVSDAINTNVPIVERSDWVARMPEDLRAAGVRCFGMNGCRILISRDPPNHIWHLSISRADRDPSWQEIATARYRLLPDVPEMAMYLPPASEYVNLHPHTFHLYEVPRSNIIVARAA